MFMCINTINVVLVTSYDEMIQISINIECLSMFWLFNNNVYTCGICLAS
jgi:hypothetical protein